MLITHPASIALTEQKGHALRTSHHRDRRALIRSLLRHRDYFDLVEGEFAEAKAIWVKEAEDDARAEAIGRELADEDAEQG